MENKKNRTSGGTPAERRKYQERRTCKDRRAATERRADNREGGTKQRRSVKIWLRSILNVRLGVDRRKGDRRRTEERRQAPRSILTKEEIRDLLSS